MRRGALILCLSLIACDGGKASPASESGQSGGASGPKEATAQTGSAPAAAVDGGVAEAPKPRPEVPADLESGEAFKVLATQLGGKESKPVEATNQRAWKHYKAKEWEEAAAQFARVALDDPAWKYAHNAACASSQGGHPERARTFLAESLRRGGDAARKRARNDADLAAIQKLAWFEPLVSGRPGAGTESEVGGDPGGETGGTDDVPPEGGTADAGSCEKVPEGCDAAEWKDRCLRFYPHHYRPEVAKALTACVQQKGCKQQHECESALTAGTTPEATEICEAMTEHYADAEEMPEPASDWKKEKGKCVKLMSLLTPEGQTATRDCYDSHCPLEGCMASLPECVHPEMEFIWEFWDVELELEP